MAKKNITSGLNGFLNFIREQGVVGLAIGLIMGVAVKDAVDGLVIGIVNPIIGLLLPGIGTLDQASIKVGDQNIVWGLFASNLLNLVVIAALIYFVVKGVGLEKLDKSKDKD